MRQIGVVQRGNWFVLFVNFHIIRYKDTVEHTTDKFSRLIRANEWGGSDNIIGANQAEKRACRLLNCISVSDDTETNEQNKSIATELLYGHSEFDSFSVLVRGEM